MNECVWVCNNNELCKIGWLLHTFRITSSYNIFCGYTVSFDIGFTSHEGRRKQSADGQAQLDVSGEAVNKNSCA